MSPLPSEEIKTERLEFLLTARQKRLCVRRMIEEDGGKVNLFARRILFEYLEGKLILNPKHTQIAAKLDDYRKENRSNTDQEKGESHDNDEESLPKKEITERSVE